MVGRPSKRTPEREARLLEALRAGNTRTAACHYAGINKDTLLEWLRRFSDFSAAIEKAEADAEVRHVANIARAAQEGTWTASAWWLERRRSEDYARHDRVEITLRQHAERLAEEFGMEVDEVLAEAERLVQS